MPATDIGQRLALIEESLRRLEDALPPPGALGLIAGRLATIDSALQALVPPQDVRGHMAESTRHIAAMADDMPRQDAQLETLLDWLHNRMTGDQLQMQFDDVLFVSKQLASAWHGARTDQLLMRAEILRLSALCEAAVATKE